MFTQTRFFVALRWAIVAILFLIFTAVRTQAAPIQCWISFVPQGNVSQFMGSSGMSNSQSATYWLNALVNPGTTQAKFILKTTDSTGETTQHIQKFVNPPSVISTPYTAVYNGSSNITFTVKDDLAKCTYSAGLGYKSDGNSLPLAIPDQSTVTSSVNMSSGTIAAVHVSLWISHSYTGDLDISLVGPDNTKVLLTSDNGSSGNNYGSNAFQRTIFADEVDYAITSAAAPFVGAFNPEQPLSAFIGKNAYGAWSLEITDDAAGDTGELMAWTLSIQYQ